MKWLGTEDKAITIVEISSTGIMYTLAFFTLSTSKTSKDWMYCFLYHIGAN